MKSTLVVAIATALALVAADTASAGSRVAYFKVSLVASQDVSWEQHTTTRTCDGGSADVEGSGTSALRLRTPRPQPALAKRVRGGAILSFARGNGTLPVVGTITRKGVNFATRVTPGKQPGCTPLDSPSAPDCGTKPYPTGRAFGVGYHAPGRWPFRNGLAPLAHSIVLTGPSARGFQPPIFRRCPGVNGDDMLRGPVYDGDPIHSSPGGLGLVKLFGTARRFEVEGHSRETVDALSRGGSVSGTWPITTKTRWTMTFTRLARRPRGL